ncbi:MAG: ABC transporter permease [Anaerolineae bacterium]|nr:ABC transporter permease [Anaerolineae bacterium]
MSEQTIRRIWPSVPIVTALLFITLLLVAVGAKPLTAYQAFFDGSFGGTDQTLSTLAFWVPLLLCSTGLLVTFTAGLWNIGVEGQMIAGAIGSSAVSLLVAKPNPSIPGWVILPLSIIVAMLCGALWAALAAVLKTRGGIHEIFSGVALNNLAIIATNYLISGPWQPPEGGTFRGTVPFPEQALFPLLGTSRFSPLSLILALIALILVALALRGTFWGLKLKAQGKNLRSAFLLGVASEREAINAMMVCGALAGLAGSVRVLSWFDSLRQSISGGIGFLAILVVLLASIRPLWTLLIGLLFSALLNGGTFVHSRVQLHSSLSGLIQGTLVLLVLLLSDYTRVFRRKETVTEANTGHE